MSERSWTVRDILKWTSERLAAAGSETPLLDAQLMLGKTLNFSKVQLYLELDRPLSEGERSGMRELVQRRLRSEPVAYLLGRKEWHDLVLTVDSRVLIPRPETETLLDMALALWRAVPEGPRRILDLCTGSGCLAIALARAFPQAQVVGVDVSEAALEVARENSIANNAAHVEFLKDDVTRDAFWARSEISKERWDLVVSNPPYLSEQEWNECAPSVRSFEPRLALVADDNGLAIARRIVNAVELEKLQMANQSLFLMELGAEAPRALCQTQKLSSIAEIFEYSSQHPPWDLPRGAYFALRDLESRPRFLAFLNGLGEASTTNFSLLSESEKSVDIESGVVS